MGAYQDYQSRRIPVGDIQRKIEEVFGAEKDEQLDRVRQALLVGIPGQGPADALGYLGTERMLPRASGETNNAYAERLRTAWDGLDGWSYAGSHGSLLRALARAGFPMGSPDGCFIVQRTKRYSYLNAGNVVFGTHDGMTWDEKPATVWNQFVVLFGDDVPGLDVDTSMAAVLNQTVRQWKPAKARFIGTYVIEQGPVWGWPPSLVWGQGGLLWGNGSSSRFIPPV